MAEVALRSEERVGLVVAIAAHIGLAALLLWHPNTAPVVVPPQRVEVTISDDVGLTSTSPQPAAEAAPDMAPDIGEPAPPEPEAEPSPLPEPPKPIAKPEPPKPVAKPEPPKPQPKPVPRPVPKPTMRPEPPRPVARPTTRPAPRPSPAPAAKPAAKPATNPAPRQSVADAFKSTTTPGGTKVGADFLKGVQGATANGPARTPPAATVGPAVRSALAGAIRRQLKPRWAAPQGADADRLVTILTWDLNRDGSLNGSPRVVRQDGITEANRAQAALHAERAIRSVRLAAPFELPVEYYDAWKHITSFSFDKGLSDR